MAEFDAATRNRRLIDQAACGAGMRAAPQFAGRFEHSHEVVDPNDLTEDQYERQTVAMINAELKNIAPDGNLLRIAPATKMSIAREIRARRREECPTALLGVKLSPFRRERSSVKEVSMSKIGKEPADAMDRLREARRVQHGQDKNNKQADS